MNNYDKINREERAICAHLFRLLHESLEKKDASPFGRLINLMLERGLIIDKSSDNQNQLDFKNIGIYTEVALIRDYFNSIKISPNEFMDQLVTLIIAQEKVNNDCRLYSNLGDPLNNPIKTHPKQIRQKADYLKIDLTKNELSVYGALQGMFNAKPDLVLTVDNKLITIEAKFTEKFDDVQLKRTKNITQVWKELLYRELGFNEKPDTYVIKLGASNLNAEISWKDIYTLAKQVYTPEDRSMIAFESGLQLLHELDFE
jgi:hypothetical protein